jgi:hypothetical protein
MNDFVLKINDFEQKGRLFYSVFVKQPEKIKSMVIVDLQTKIIHYRIN